jgi:hypothetical protein
VTSKGVTIMKNYFFALSLGLGGVLWTTQNAHAQPQPTCAQHSVVVERLQSRFGEVRQSIGLGQNNSVVEMFASTATGTWTIVVTNPRGVACLVASGESWEALNEPQPAKGNDA